MFPVFLLHLRDLKPLILIPGTYASVLKMQGRDMQSKTWYCPSRFDDILWIDESRWIPPLHNCVIDWMTLYYDYEKNFFADFPGSHFEPLDFGGLAGVTQIDYLPFNYSFVPYYKKMINYFKIRGYVERENIFGAPNDWRRGIAGQVDLYPKLKELVEEAYIKNGGKKVVLFGHSFGGFISHYFTNKFMDERWVNKHIDHVIIVAPSFTGAGEAVQYAWNRMIPQVSYFNSSQLTNCFESMGAIHTHFPNYKLHRDNVIIVGPDGTNYTADKVVDLMIQNGRFNGQNIDLVKLQVPYFEEMPPPPRVKETLIYNSQHKTQSGIKLNGWGLNDGTTPLYSNGDGTLLSDAAEVFCNAYNKTYNLKCHDLMEPGSKGGHFGMIKNDEYIEMFFDLIQK